ncbi:hypothetical protein BP6252_00695 [Coleophoma cylindrospora]|uniref:Nucleoporin n=1 Tax=Coleophoma cylindrospora TaxID=1849047 RepID=A0A3D8SQS4_9HELO|nr:hypothetical protein BP6252_00695 [Coleophoma cylindrospora]
MANPNTFEGIKDLRAELTVISADSLVSLDRLVGLLEAQIEALRGLLDKKTRNEQSRKSLTSGTLKLGDQEFGINEEFQQNALQLADEVDLDEVTAGALFYEAQYDAGCPGQSTLESAIIRFHQQRINTLDCLRIIAELSLDVDQDDFVRQLFQRTLDILVQPPEGPRDASGNASKFVRKCLSSMGDVRQWLQKLSDKLNGASVLGLGQQPEFLTTIEFQRGSLVRQHELLGMIVHYFVKSSRSSISDFEHILNDVEKFNRYDNLLLHYFPAIAANISRFGAPEGGGTIEEARRLNEKFFPSPETKSWALPYVHAAFRAWWLAEYSGWYSENYGGPAIAGAKLDEEAKLRSKQFSDALKDGAFDFILSMSADVKIGDWSDPARHGLRQWLQRKAPALLPDSVPFSNFFQGVLMEQLESFIEGFITNLPDVLRKLRIDEDEQRQLSQLHEHDLDLERFLVIISYSFENRPKAAMEGFWDVPDGALIGFMHWASRRASTPLVSAFCEMLQALSDDEDCATQAHQFLLDDGPLSSGKMRRTHSLTWRTIITELSYFCERIRNQPALPQSQSYRNEKANADAAETEPESVMMLECYLRLITKLCTESGEARDFLLQHQTFHLVEMLLQLASSSILPRLRACAFTTLRSLASHKNRQVGEFLWTSLDLWICGGYSPSSNAPKSAQPQVSSAAIQRIFQEIGTGFEQPNAFVELLHALVLPYDDDAGLRDGLSFPENLGSSFRMPGIDPYIDFAVGQIFGGRLADSVDSGQLRFLQLTCLDFIRTSLQTFNEDLVILANRSNVSVDTAITASDLDTYVRLHPFSRVMEWIYSETVMSALLGSLHQDAAEVGAATPDSPLLECLLRGIEVATLILELQPTYLDIIRPAIKLRAGRRQNIPSAAYASFEDGVLSHLSVVSDLGLYCGLGHSHLTMASLKLLQRLAASPKFASPSAVTSSKRTDRNKAIAALEANNDAEYISSCLSSALVEKVDFARAPQVESYQIKVNILDFLTSCIQSSPGRPTIAHLLLGFGCGSDKLYVIPDSPFSNNSSLFHVILSELALGLDIYDEENATMLSSRITLSYKAIEVLKLLWSSPLSANLTMTEMRAQQALSNMFISEPVIHQDLTWDGMPTTDPSFLSSPPAACLSDFLSRRASMLQYISAELLQIVQGHSQSLKTQVVETLLGSTSTDGGKIQNSTIFDIFDFMEFDVNQMIQPPEDSFVADVDFGDCLEELNGSSEQIFNIHKVEELLLLRRAELQKTGALTTPHDEDQFGLQAQNVMAFLLVDNQIKQLKAGKVELLRSWVQVMLVLIKVGDFTGPTKTSFVLQSLQTIMPRLENSLEDATEALELARLARGLLFSFDFNVGSADGEIGDLTSERLFHLFQVSLRAIHSPASVSSLKDTFYEICYRYLAGMSETAKVNQRHSIQTIRAAGERLIDLICDDAYAGEPMCRISALLFLGTLVRLGNDEKSKYIIDSLNRLNFINILVDSIQNMTDDLRETSHEDTPIQLAYCNARLSLLLQICQTRQGATVVLNAGLFRAIRASGLFAIDPDLGVVIDDANAVSKHYDLLVAIMRVICTAVLSRGSQNEQTLDQGRRFLSDNRLSILTVFKRSAGLGSGGAEESVDELADSFMLLISATGFLEFEEQTSVKPVSARTFT